MRYDELKARLLEIEGCDADSEACLILEHLFGATRADIILSRERDYPSERIEELISKREQKIPLQYIIGKWYFMGLELNVSPDCLIPRPDTEILVYEAIKLLKTGGTVCDLCTGSGCIGLSILKHRSDTAHATLVDISSGALDIARQNSKCLSLDEKCTLLTLDVTLEMPHGRFDMIVSNPPYIPSADIATLSDEVKKEPTIALDGGSDGLSIINSILRLAPSALAENGYLLIEFGYDQSEKIVQIMDGLCEKGIYSSYKILKDYGANDRVLVCQA